MSVARQIQKITSLKRKGALAEAEALCSDLLAAFPKNPKARKLMAELQALQSATAKPSPAEIDALNAAVHDTAKLRALAEDITARYPDDASGWAYLGSAAHNAGDNMVARRAFETVLALDPENVDGLYNLGATLCALGELSEAEALTRRAITLRPNMALAHFSLGTILNNQGRVDASIPSLRKAAELQPDFASAHYNLANALRDAGQGDAAIPVYERAIMRDPAFLPAYVNLCGLKPFAPDHRFTKTLETRLKAGGDTADSLYRIHFALARVYDKSGDYARAFAHFEQGNAHRRAVLGYAFASDEAEMAKLHAAIKPMNEARFQPGDRGSLPVPIFILGMPRSGTTLFEQILTAHPHISGGGELPHLVDAGYRLMTGAAEPTEENLARFRNRYLRAIEKISDGKPYVTDKMPSNFRGIHLIRKALPEAIIFHTTRDAQAVCWSNYKHNFTADGLGYAYKIDDLISYYGLYEALMERFNSEYGSRVIEMNYETLTTQQRPTTEAAIAAIGVPWDEACMSPHKNQRQTHTASNAQVKREIYQGSSQKWRNYEPFLNGAFDKLAKPAP